LRLGSRLYGPNAPRP